MIVLFTDFGYHGPYIGQMEAAIKQIAPSSPIIHLTHYAPAEEPVIAGYLLAAWQNNFPADTIFVCVVDPGVGGKRRAITIQADDCYFIGPDNGLLNTVAKQAKKCRWWKIAQNEPSISTSFHGRDIFAPLAAHLANGEGKDQLFSIKAPDLQLWPEDLEQIIYFDDYGNAMTGLNYQIDYEGRLLQVGDLLLKQGHTFCSVAQGEAFWYCNSSQLIEIAINRGNACKQMNLSLKQKVQLI